MAIFLNPAYSQGKFLTPAGTLILLILVMLLSGCQQPESPLRVGSAIWPGYEPLYLARDLGFYTQTPVHLVEFPSASTVIRHFHGKTIDAAALTLDETLYLRQLGVEINVVLIMDFSNGADVLLAKPGITRLEQLRGKTIGVEHTATGAVLLDGALSAAGLSIKDVKLRYLTVNEHDQAWRKHKIDAVVTYEPVKTRLLSLGANLIFDSSRIPGRITDVLAVRHKIVKKQPKAVRQLIAGYFRARHYLQQHPADAAEKMALRMALPPQQVAGMFSGLSIPNLAENKRLLGGNSPLMRRNAQLLSNIMLRQGLLSSPVSTRDMWLGTLLPDTPL